MTICPTCQCTYPDAFSVCPRDGAPLAAVTKDTEAQLAAGLSRRFRIIRQLGKGGMGTVFLAEQIAVGNRPVALKVLNRKLLDDPDFLIRFQNEAGSTGRIHHPNVVTIFESGQGDDGTPYIAMEFLEGESLRELLTRQGALPATEVAEILQQMARGLNAAHKLGIIHRDLKPDNIFLAQGYNESVPQMSQPASVQVKIVDFGIAKLRESATHTMTGTVLGTPAYMSFEQASGMRSDELDARSDVYSLGVVVYEMLTGRTPFDSDTPVGYLRKHLMEEPPPFRAVKPGHPVALQIERVVIRALSKDRNQRYSSVLEFAHGFAKAAVTPAHLATRPEPQRETVKHHPQATVTPTVKPIIPAVMGDTVVDKPFPKTGHASRQNWLISHWKKIGIIASVVWILGAGSLTLKSLSDRNLEDSARYCHAEIPGTGTEYEKCLNSEYAKFVSEEREMAASFAFVPALLGWGFVLLVFFLARWISRAAIAHPSQRKWIGSHWKKIGSVASVVWILGTGVHLYKIKSEDHSRSAAVLKQECVKEKEWFDYSECVKNREASTIGDPAAILPSERQKVIDAQRDAMLQCSDEKDKNEDKYRGCLENVDVIVAKYLPDDLEFDAAFVFVPILLAWGFAYLVRFLARRSIRQSVASEWQ